MLSFKTLKDIKGIDLKIHTWPSAVLKKPSLPVEQIDDGIKELVRNMLYTMYKKPGIGLAAPQVGHSKRLFVLDLDYKREKTTDKDGLYTYSYANFNPLVFINPTLVTSGEEVLFEEGCLSVPGIYEQVKRKKIVKVNFLDINGNNQEMIASDLLGVCIQHENDHLDGIVFLEKLSNLKRQFITNKLLKLKKKKK